MPSLRLLLPAALLAGCATLPPFATPPVAPAEQPRFDPLVFFEGRLVGEGRLDTMMSGTVPVRVESAGRVEGGVLRLEQTIHEGDKPPRTREWTMRRAGPGRITGTLTDAEGPVAGTIEGNRLHLSFPMEDGLQAEQTLTLAPDGRSASNVMKVRMMGVTVAALSETIRNLE